MAAKAHTKKASRTTKTPRTARVSRVSRISPPPLPDARSEFGAPLASTGSEAAYERFLPEATKLAARDVQICRAEVPLLMHNVQLGVDGVLPFRARLAKELPLVDSDRLAALPALASAVVFAASQVDRSVGSTGEIAKLLKRANAVRDKLLTAAFALAGAGLFPQGAVDRIHRGTGLRDRAQDCVDLVALYRKHASKTKGKTAITDADLKESAEVGNALLGTLRPAKAKRKTVTPAEVKAAADARDRLWTLLARDHDVLRRVGFYFFGERAIDEHVPALQARAAAKKTKAAPPPAPVAKPA